MSLASSSKEAIESLKLQRILKQLRATCWDWSINPDGLTNSLTRLWIYLATSLLPSPACYMLKLFAESRLLSFKSHSFISCNYRNSTVRFFSSTRPILLNMAGLKVELTAPNGRKITLPTGLFINNEFVKSSSGDKITSINPT